ncbi:hypothetical protein LOTGIDRAFT_231811 [Lottia gigantea]|uniref:UPAR/Ly6 domain-containing protein n=1 Tax=Lottia gigantea TaxID=225164 RepID=V4AMM2_LOTGI|nr:hypothetical protein LOTGIDRAFT_231811 [Lottia gigantea]ESO96020.1 hypothetical protein LOTGIDRAFT_231811 [Lottia gigantea]
MKISTSTITSCFIVCHIFTSLVSSYDERLEDLFETEGLLPLHKPQSEQTRVKLPTKEPSIKSTPSPYRPPNHPSSRQRADMADFLESEAFEKPLSRYRRANPDDNVEGSGGDPASTTSAPTLQCHEVVCSGQDCVSSFDKTDTSKQCLSQGSCYIRARYNETLKILQTVEARCDERSFCEWQTITLDEFTEVSNCCTDNLCNDPTLLASSSSKFHQNTVFQLLLCLMTILLNSCR